MKKAKRVRNEMLIGIFLWTFVCMIVLLFVFESKLSVLAGGLFGGATATLLLFHMYKHIDIVLDLDKESAKKHGKVAAVQRVGIMAVSMGLSMYFMRYINPVATVLGIFGLKIGAFLQPVLHKFFSSLKKGG